KAWDLLANRRRHCLRHAAVAGRTVSDYQFDQGNDRGRSFRQAGLERPDRALGIAAQAVGAAERPAVPRGVSGAELDRTVYDRNGTRRVARIGECKCQQGSRIGIVGLLLDGESAVLDGPAGVAHQELEMAAEAVQWSLLRIEAQRLIRQPLGFRER